MFWCCCRTHVALERRGWAKSLMRDAGCFGVAVARTDESIRGCAAPVGGGFRSEVVVGCLTKPFLHLHSDTHGGVLHSAHPLHGPRRPPESRPPPPPPHRRFVQRGRHAPGRSSLMWPPLWECASHTRPSCRGSLVAAPSGPRAAHILAARVRLRCGHCRDLTQSPHVPILTAFLLSQVV